MENISCKKKSISFLKLWNPIFFDKSTKISMESILNKAHVQVYVQEFKIKGETINYLLTINYS